VFRKLSPLENSVREKKKKVKNSSESRKELVLRQQESWTRLHFFAPPEHSLLAGGSQERLRVRKALVSRPPESGTHVCVFVASQEFRDSGKEDNGSVPPEFNQLMHFTCFRGDKKWSRGKVANNG